MRPQKKKYEYRGGAQARDKFESTMKNLFSVPKAKVDEQKSAHKAASAKRKRSDKD